VQQVACVAGPDTILAWYRRLIAHKFDGSKQRRDVGRPRIGPEIEELVVRLARENSGWGYDRIVGALGNLGHVLAGTDFFTVEVLTWRGLVTWYVLFFLHLDSRNVTSAVSPSTRTWSGCSKWPVTPLLGPWGHPNGCRYVLHGRDTKFCRSFQETLAEAEVKCLRLPARSPNLNPYAEK
jgi:putative transposase